jgi:hypothetical protein
VKKTTFILLLLFNLFLSFAGAFVTMVRDNFFMNENDFFWVTIMVAIGLFIILGLVSALIYYILKRNGISSAAKIAMFIFTSFLLVGTLSGLPDLSNNLKRRREFRAEINFQEGFKKGCMERGKASLQQLSGEGFEITDEKVVNFCDCIFNKIKDESGLMNQIKKGTMKPGNIEQNPKYIQMVSTCAPNIVE